MGKLPRGGKENNHPLPPLSLPNYNMVRASDTRAVTFEDVVVPDENRLGEEGAGFILAMKVVCVLVLLFPDSLLHETVFRALFMRNVGSFHTGI